MAIEYLGPLTEEDHKDHKIEYLGPLDQPERTKLNQPLLKKANSTSMKDVPEAVLLIAKQMIVDFPLTMGAFVGGATYDAYDALLKKKFSFENARKAHDYMATASRAAYSKIRSMIPGGSQEGAEQIANNIFAPLEKFARKGGEITTDLTDSAIAGATTYATLQVLPFILAGEVPGVRSFVKGVEQKNLAPMMEGFREAGTDVPVKMGSPKQPLFDAKSALFGVIKNRIEQLKQTAAEQPQQGQQQSPQVQKQVQELQTLKQVNDSLGVANAGEIPEGKIIDLKPAAHAKGKTVGGQKLKSEAISFILPKELAGAKPRYSYGIKRFELKFENDIDKASYISSQIKKSKRDADYVDFVRKSTGWTEQEVRFHGGEVKNRIKMLAKDSEPGMLNIESVFKKEETPIQFIATNNIKEYQKDLTAAKQELAEIVQETIKEQPKGGRRKLIKERVEAAKAAKLKEIDELSHYEETADPLIVSMSEVLKEESGVKKTRQDTLYKPPATVEKAVTLSDIKYLADKNELGVNANIGANGNMIVSIVDKYYNKADFPLSDGGCTLKDVHNFVKDWTDDFAESMKKQYEIKAEIISNAPELVKLPGVTKKHTIPTTGEIIEYQTVGDLKMQYELRGLPWKGNKKEYYKAKKIDEAAKKEMDDKLTPLSKQSLPEIELLDSQGNGKKPGMLSWMEPFRFVAQDIEQRTGFPMQQFESKIRDGMRQVNVAIVPYLKRLRESRKGMNYESSVRIYKALEQPAFRESEGNFYMFKQNVNKEKKLSGMLGGMTKVEYNAAGKIRKILGDAATEFNVPIDKMVLDYAPRMLREGVSGWEEAIKKWQLPEEYKWAALEERSGYMRPHEEQIFKVVDAYLRRGAQKRYVGNYLEELSTRLNETKFESKADIDQLNRYVATMRGWQTGFDESVRVTGETIARGLNKMINWPLEKVGLEPSTRYRNVSYKKKNIERKVIDLETGRTEVIKTPAYVKVSEEPGFFDIHRAANDFVNLHLKLSYAGALAWRPMVWARAIYQSTLCLPIVGPRAFAKAMAKAASPKAWAESKAATALFAESPVAGGELSRGWTIMDDITQMSTWDTRAGHNLARHIAYQAGRENAASEGAKFLENLKSGMSEKEAIDKFINDSGADFFHPVLLKNEVIPLLKARDIESLSERMGFHTVAETQWLYEKGQAPYWARSITGRVLGQFGVWPSWYIKYARNLIARGSKVNRAKRVAGLMGINLLSYEIGKNIFGVDISGWTLTHPFMWFPLPVQAWESARQIMGGHSDYEKEKGKSAMMNLAYMHIPGYLAYQSAIKGMEETDEEDKFKVFMGFKPAKED